MGAVLNGLSLSKVRPFGSGFLIFSDYARPAIRLSALMEIPVVHIFTHDSIGVGEDGPTHQPVEQLASLRAIPGLITLRPADANEVVEAWRYLMPLRHHPVALVLSRQALPTFDRTKYAPPAASPMGAYVMADPVSAPPAVILIATGSEVALCIEAHQQLAAEGIGARVVSMPSWELFEARARTTATACCRRTSSRAWPWSKRPRSGGSATSGMTGAVVGMRTFGASAPLKALQQKFGFTPEHVVAMAKEQLR